MSEFYSFN